MPNAGAVGSEDVKMARLQRERDDVARSCRDPAWRHRDQEMAGTLARDMRLVPEPLIGHDAHADIARPDRDLLRSDADPNMLGLHKRLPCHLIERIRRNWERDIGANR